MFKKIILWILIIGCMATIFRFSSQVAEESKKTSSRVITTVVEAVDVRNRLTEPQKVKITEDLTFLVRKGAHFSIYALLGALIFLLVREYNVRTGNALAAAVIIAMLYACSDEFHQTFVSGRSGELRDIAIDTVGAVVGCMIVMSVTKFIKIRRQRNGLQENL